MCLEATPCRLHVARERLCISVYTRSRRDSSAQPLDSAVDQRKLITYAETGFRCVRQLRREVTAARFVQRQKETHRGVDLGFRNDTDRRSVDIFINR